MSPPQAAPHGNPAHDASSAALLNIGEAAKASGVSAKMIRHYESIGLFPEAMRTASGYRQYGPRELATLRFVRQSRDLGFSLEHIRELLGLWHDRSRPSRQVKALAEAQLLEIDAKLRELQSMRATLAHLVAACHGDDLPDCPILERLAQAAGAETVPSAQAPAASPNGQPAQGISPGRTFSRAWP